ncbi:MAG TPA: RNA-directed DNA polymerase [Allosphingosinicella sp.]|nr:RNA-directed DNA polymerase [Allosphingosinicella sp.]
MKPRAEALAAKAVHQYRGRDIFAYLALRYYLEATAARGDRWTEDNAAQIVLGSPAGRYLNSYHFKALRNDGSPEHRQLSVPNPSEALIEALLICSSAEAWRRERSDQLFSYDPTERTERGGYFRGYMPGLRERQRAIAKACLARPTAIVRYVDIKAFYPSITPARADAAWSAFSERHAIPKALSNLGHKLIRNHSIESSGKSVLTGPMFSHFIANLVLKDLDDAASRFTASYFRYVDDITLVGEPAEIENSLRDIINHLDRLGLRLHLGDAAKDITVAGSEWLKSAEDYRDEASGASWMKLVGNIKKLLLLYPNVGPELEARLQENGFRFPMPDYDQAVRERGAFEKVRRLALWVWLLFRSRRATIKYILADALELRKRFQRETHALLAAQVNESQFQRKRRVSKLRYRLGRLAYLSESSELRRLAEQARALPELRFHAALLGAITSLNCSEVLSLGTNVAQSAAQIFRAMGETARLSSPVRTEAELQGLAVLIMNGVSVEGEVGFEGDALLQIARGNVGRELMKNTSGFLQELACLHGSGPARHASIIKTAFDVEQDIFLDALEFEYGYYF